MAGVFINYRRDDAPGVAGRLFDHLARHFPRRGLFMDIDAMKPGMDFVKQLDAQVSQCDVLLAMIGPHWLAARDDHGRRRLDSDGDYVRIELASALKRDIPVIPVLIDGVAMPSEDELPDDLKPLVRRHAVELRHTRFSADADSIVHALADIAPPRRVGRAALAGAALVVVAGATIVFFWPSLKATLEQRAEPTPAAVAPAARPSVLPVPPSPKVQPPARAPETAAPPRPDVAAPPKTAVAPLPTQRTAAVVPGLRVALGDTLDHVREVYAITADATSGGAGQLRLAAPREGLLFFFDDKDKRLLQIRADAPFSGSIHDVKIGDSLDGVLAKLGQPYGPPWDFGANKAYVFHDGANVLRCDFDNQQRVATIFSFVVDR